MVEYDAAPMMVHRAHAAPAPVDEYDAPAARTSNVDRPPAARGGIQILGMVDDKLVDVPVVRFVQVPQVQVVEDTVDNPRLTDRGEIVEIPQIQTFLGTQTSESQGAAPFRWVALRENVEVVETRAPLPAESAHPDVRHGTRLGSSSSCLLYTYNPLPSCSLCRFHRCRLCEIRALLPAESAHLDVHQGDNRDPSSTRSSTSLS